MFPIVNEELKNSESSVSIKAAKDPRSDLLSCPTVAALPPTPQIDMCVSQIYVFVAALKHFIFEYLYLRNNPTPHTFCRLNQFRASSNAKRDTEWYGAHTWLEEFIYDIITQNLKINRLKHPEHYSNYAKKIQEGKFKTPLHVISSMYLKFITKRCFGEQTRPIGMILLQPFTLKCIHYTTLPFHKMTGDSG
ncbi:uncharacterized protein EAF01_000379 [Botrytis porri]|uniref:uncharacterized protein n=1 Tax=Botrytis porri TaxID=87229 RepID=UPI0018FF2798|nr:uncharacterized protein EAF01_000379 [Botrytis porri]KAF7913973.1 hypothetical protein EAF01_000379 [Botrytis porri]